MKCLHCGEQMNETKGNVPYHSLKGTILQQMTINECPECGERDVEIPNISALNRTLARATIYQPQRLAGYQIRFLRKFLDLTGRQLAKKMGVEPETLSKWENERQPMSRSNGRLLRMLIAFELSLEGYSSYLSALPQSDDKPPYLKLWKPPDDGWYLQEGVSSLPEPGGPILRT